MMQSRVMNHSKFSKLRPKLNGFNLLQSFILCELRLRPNRPLYVYRRQRLPLLSLDGHD
eukprot:UN06590